VTGVIVTGWSAVTSAGVGGGGLARVASIADVDAGVDPGVDPGVDVTPDWQEPLPAARAHALLGFTAREHLGRKGTSTYDRATSLAVLACRDALSDAGIDPGATDRARVGIVLGTTVGSFRSTSDFSAETLIQPKPYLVNPSLFPNTVMNSAAGQAAIRLGLRGVNATLAAGRPAALHAVRYAVNAIRRGHADVVLAGAVEEFSPHRAWAGHLTGAGGDVPIGEAAAVVVLSRSGAEAPGRRPDAEVLAVGAGYGPSRSGGGERALESCVHRALDVAGVAGPDVTMLLTGERSWDDDRETGPATRALGHRPRRVLVARRFGDCEAAGAAVALASLLARHRDGERDGEVSLLTSRSADGGVAAAVVRGWSCPR
jgi:3-oxoacyl-[acyl-carrier-protein] synthase II